MRPLIAMFVFQLFYFLIVNFVGFVESNSQKSNANSFEHIYSKLLKEDNSINKIQGVEKEVRYFMRNVLMKILSRITEISELESISKNCESSLVKYMDGLVEEEGWALEMFDSSSKPPSGLLEGTVSELGSFDQCLDIELLSSNGSAEFAAQYCAVEIEVNPTQDLSSQKNISMDSINVNPHAGSQLDYSNFRLGVCVPSKCTQQDMREIADHASQNFQMEIRIPKCYVKEPVVLKPVHIATICAVCLLLLLGICGSIIEHGSRKLPIEIRNTGRCRDVISCFSLISNYRRLVSDDPETRRRDKWRALPGMRALTLGWVMLGHNYYWTNFLLARRPKQFTDAFQKQQLGFIFNSWLSVEPFFVISGVMTSYSVLKLLHATRGRINVPFFILRRHFRNALLLSLTMGLAFFLPLVSSGPFWYAMGADAELDNCVRRWWAGLLCVSNWFGMKDICISPASWYISADLQLHATSLLFLYPLYRRPKLGLSLVACCIVICCVEVGAVTYEKDLPPIIDTTASDKQKVQDTIDFVHLSPFTHAGPYYVGVVVGYVLFKENVTRISKMHKALGWLTSIALALTALYGGARDWNSGHPHGPLVTSLFAAVHRTTFAIAVAWVIVVCVTGNAGFVTRLLSSSPLCVAGRLTFIVFLAHSLVFWTRKGSVRERMFLSHYNLLYEYIGNVSLTVLLALPFHLLLEAPITRLDALLFPEKEKPDVRVTNAQTAENDTSPTTAAKEGGYPEHTQNIYICYPSRSAFSEKS